MENISAVYAVEWSIELEKGIRSKTPGRAVQAIQKLGPQLCQWNKEPELTFIEYNIFGLIPGEDSLFANTILFRLAEAFRLGDTNIRTCIVRVFLSMLRDSSLNGAQKNKIFSKHKITNRKELLRIIKTVFSNGDGESRALALVLFGCWADFAIDSADIRYLILSGLVSFDDFEVKASLYAVGRFCTFSDDFASVVTEMLLRIMTSSVTSPSVRLAGIQTLAKIDCSFPLATKIFQVGVKLVLESLEEDFLGPLLISLSKFVSMSTLLMSEQVELLFRILTPDATSQLKTITLKCLCFLFQRGVHCSSYSGSIRTLFCLLDASVLPLSSQFHALQILYEILIYKSPSPLYPNLIDVPKLIKIVENPNNVYIFSMRVIAIRALLVISDIFNKEKIQQDGASITSPLQLHVMSVVFNKMILVVKIALDLHPAGSVMDQEIKNLLKLLLLLVKHHPDLDVSVMDRIITLVEFLVKACDENNRGTLEADLRVVVIEKILFYVYKFVMACLEAPAFGSQIFYKAKSVAELVCRCNLFNCYTRSIYYLLLNSGHEVGALECAKELLSGKYYWLAYRVGRYAACQGAWCTSALIFGNIRTLVNSDSCCGKWLKSLALFCDSEMKFKSLMLSRGSSPLLERDNMFLICSEKLISVWDTISSAREALGRTSSFHNFCFQNWVLSVRSRFVEIVMDILKLLGSVQNFPGQVDDGTILYRFAEISFRFKRLALEYDLIAASFDMDKRSLEIISAHAIECSVLAFCAGFTVLFCDRSEKLESDWILLVQDLIDRLWHSDSESCTDLRSLLLNVTGGSRGLALKSRIVCRTSYDALNVCRFAVREIVGLQNESGSGVHNKETHTKKGFSVLFDVLEKWMRIPFQCPKYFFRVRACMGSELYMLKRKEQGKGEEDGGMLAVSRGSHLSVDVCLQLKNTPRDVRKSYCILQFRESFLIKGGGPSEAVEGFEELVDLNEELLGYVMRKECGGNKRNVVFVEFGGGRFSTCLLDVSEFPVGCYLIKWHSCFIDCRGHYHSLIPLNHAPVFTVIDDSLHSHHGSRET